MPFLVVMTSIFMHTAMPFVSMMFLEAFSGLQDSQALVGGTAGFVDQA